jgi:type II secretory pathway component PulM
MQEKEKIKQLEAEIDSLKQLHATIETKLRDLRRLIETRMQFKPQNDNILIINEYFKQKGLNNAFVVNKGHLISIRIDNDINSSSVILKTTNDTMSKPSIGWPRYLFSLNAL